MGTSLPAASGIANLSARKARAGVKMLNRQVVLVSRPSGIAQAENFAIREATVVSPAEGQMLVRNEFVSVEPAMRGWIADRGNYSAPVAIGSVMRALAVSEVVESRHADYRAGETVTGWFGWQEFATIGGDAVIRRVLESRIRSPSACSVSTASPR
jgi:NADPH-dependent curcumin reductase